MSETFRALLLSALAGGATIIGAILSLFLKREKSSLTLFCSSLAAGVMLYGALTEILKKGLDLLLPLYSERDSMLLSACAFFSGILFLLLVETFFPEEKTGQLVALSLSLHNFPEGLCTFVSALAEPQLAWAMVCAIALHNIPEGIAVSVSLLQGGKSRKSAFLLSSLSGLAEPCGALCGALVLLPFSESIFTALLFCFCAGLMCHLALFELFAPSYAASPPMCLFGTTLGMAIMAISLCLFA